MSDHGSPKDDTSESASLPSSLPSCRSAGSADTGSVAATSSSVSLRPVLDNEQIKTFVKACKEGDFETIKALLSTSTIESNRDSEGYFPIHHACLSGSPSIVALLISLGHSTKTLTSQSDTGLHIACREGHVDIVREILVQSLQAESGTEPGQYLKIPVYQIQNRMGLTALGVSVLNAHRPQFECATEILKQTRGNPADLYPSTFKLRGFRSLPPTRSPLAYPLDDPLKLFVVGDNGAGKSTFIQSLQADPSLFSKILGLAVPKPVSRRNVDQHFTGIIMTETYSKDTRVIFCDLAGHTNYFQEELLESEDDLRKSIFVVIVKLTKSHSVIIERLLYWLTFIHYHCSKVVPASASSDSLGQAADVCPNVVIVGSFYDNFSIALWPPSWQKLSDAIKSIELERPEMFSQFNILDTYSLNCKKTNKPTIVQLRSHLYRKCKEMRPNSPLPPSICYLVSTFLELEMAIDSAPTLRALQEKICEKASESSASQIWYQLIPQDIDELFDICQILNKHKRIVLFPNPTSDSHADWWIMHHNALLREIDDKLFSLRSVFANEDKALITLGRLYDTLVSSQLHSKPIKLDINLIIQLLEHFKYCEEITHLEEAEHPPSGGERLFFFPSLLQDHDRGERDITWSTLSDEPANFRFAWCLIPEEPVARKFFMPRYLKMLLLSIIRKFMTASSVIYCRGASWTTEERIQACVIMNDTAVILTMRCHQGAEMKCLELRNQIRTTIIEEKNKHQPEISVSESFIPITEEIVELPLKRIEDYHHPVSLPELYDRIVQGFRTTENNDVEIEDLLYFEPAFYLRELCPPNRELLTDISKSTMELDDTFMHDLRECLGRRGSNLLHFHLPVQHQSSTTITSHASTVVQMVPLTGTMVTEGSGRYTYGKLLKVFDSVAIFNTAELLKNCRLILQTAGSQLSITSVVSIPTCLPHMHDKSQTEIEQSSLSNVPFLHDVKVYQCSSSGGFCKSIAGDDIILDFPKDAVPHLSPPIRVEVGVTLNGPFIFKENVRPVSPIVWISAGGFAFEKEVEVTLHHFIDCGENTTDLVFYESVLSSNGGNHTGSAKEFHFRPSPRQSVFKADSSSGTIHTTQLNSFMCICYRQPEQIAARAKYCIVKVTAPCNRDGTVFLKHFVLTYFLDTCIEMVKRQYHCLPDSHEVQVMRRSLQRAEGAEMPVVAIQFQQQPGSGWIVCLDSGHNEIALSEVDFCSCDMAEILRMRKLHLYPPRFTIKVNGVGAGGSAILNGEITGFTKSVLIQEALCVPQAKLGVPQAKLGVPHRRKAVSDSEVECTSGSQRRDDKARHRTVSYHDDETDNSKDKSEASDKPQPPTEERESPPEPRPPPPEPRPAPSQREQVERVFRSIAPEIQHYLDVEAIRPFLFSAGVIDTNTYEKLMVMEAARQREHLLLLLIRSGVKGLLRFRKALKKTRDSGYVGHGDILQQLEQNFDFQNLLKQSHHSAD